MGDPAGIGGELILKELPVRCVGGCHLYLIGR